MHSQYPWTGWVVTPLRERGSLCQKVVARVNDRSDGVKAIAAISSPGDFKLLYIYNIVMQKEQLSS